jgi:hypothetical protein
VIKSVVVAELNCDTSSDLPAVDGLSGRILAQGSIAWDIATGDFYGLNSSGTWVNQSGEEESNSVQSLSASPRLSKLEVIENAEPAIEDGEENDEPLRDTESL